jgi:hypothetical protein
VKLKPLEYKFNVSDNGLQLNVEARSATLCQLSSSLAHIFCASHSLTYAESKC